MKLTIDRAKWLRGEGAENSYLIRREDGKMCCLGFYAISKGATPDQITGYHCPHQVSSLLSLAPELVYDPKAEELPVLSSDAATNLMAANDLKHNYEESREKAIKSGFLEMGVEVEFIN